MINTTYNQDLAAFNHRLNSTKRKEKMQEAILGIVASVGGVASLYAGIWLLAGVAQ